MSNSGRKINYSVRPAKNIERKMMRDFFMRLSKFERLEDYRYVGFGSKYFSDFILFHKSLNISEMISIEVDSTNKDRYEFNKPYSNIIMEWGHSSERLPSIVRSQKRTIYWLDYDGAFEYFILQDASIIAEAACTGSVLAISFNCEPPKFEDKSVDSLRDALLKQVGKDMVPSSLDTRGWKSIKTNATFLKNCLKNRISSDLTRRNYSIPNEDDKLNCLQQLFFTYADGATMVTVVFLLLSQKECKELAECRINDLYFIRTEDEPFDISTPNFTIKEIRHLMEIRPDNTKINTKIFTTKDVELLWQNYRYFPGFAEIESY
jgi:hypothetical protein